MGRLFELAARRRLALAYLAIPLAAAPLLAPGCYSTGDGTGPPPAAFYFPVGMTVSRGGNVLYVVNSDFDLQWNGGTIQSYDLHQIRVDAAISAAGFTLSPQLPLPEGGGVSEFLDGATSVAAQTSLCASGATLFLADGGLVSSCTPVTNSAVYVRDSVVIGAFATDLQLSPTGNRLYSPVRGDASLTWATVVPDVEGACLKPSDCASNICRGGTCASLPATANERSCDADGGGACYAPFAIQCGQGVNGGRCDATHHAGVNPNEPGNTRNLTMPGEPFAMAQTEDGTALVLTHQSEGDTSLFLTGLTEDGGPAQPSTPSMQYVVDAGLPMGGDGIGTIPHDQGAYTSTAQVPRPAFLETNNTTAQLNLLRYYADNGTTVFPDAGIPDANLPITTTLQRPFLEVERTITLTALSSGTDGRGIVFDTSARLKCEHYFPFPDARYLECARLPARTFFSNRAPNALVIGTTGGPSPTDPSTYDADALYISPVPVVVDPGPSRVYLAPIVDADGNYALRVFVVCFDGNAIDVVNPDTQTIEASIPVGQGPFAMAFDPFDPLDVALNRQVQPSNGPITTAFTQADGSSTEQIPLPPYRYAYVASFTNSFVQVIDLDNSEPDKSTFETVVYTLGSPSVPKGNQ
jgi:hypothetical protein